MVCNPFCCTSIRTGAKRVAIIDIILFFITLVISVGLECGLSHSVPMRITLFDDDDSGRDSEEAMDIMENSPDSRSHEVGKAVWMHVSNAIKNANEINIGLGYLMYMGLLLAIMGYVILEIWLCCVLIRAASEGRPEFCKKWLMWRCAVLLLSVLMNGINVVQLQYTYTDLCWQPLNIFRLYTILVVVQLRKEIFRSDPKLVIS